MEYQVSKRLRVFSEFQFISQAYAPTNGHLTKYIVNNQDNTSTLQQSQGNSEIVFVDAMQSDPTASPSPNEPQIRAKHSYPFHSYGLNVGVKYILWEKEKAVKTAN